MEYRTHPLAASTAHRRDKGEMRSLRGLFRYFAPYAPALLGATVAILFTSGAMLGLGAALSYWVDHGIAAGNPNLLDQGFFIMLGVVALLAAAAYARFYLVSWIGDRVTADLRRDVFARVIAMDMPYFETTRTGELLSRMTADTLLIQTVLTSTVSVALRNLLMIAGGTILLMLTSHKLTLMVLVMLPVVILPIILLGKRVRFWSREAQSRLADINVETEETIYGIRTLQSFALEGYRRERFQRALDYAGEAATRRIRLRSILTALVIGLVFSAVMVVLWMGGRDVLTGEISPGQLSSFVFYAVVVAGATGAISDILGELQRAAGAAERVQELLVLTPSIASPANPQPLPNPLKGEIVFDRVVFHYPSRPDKASLENFSLEVKAGETVALVGPSGAGKSTVLQLIERFYDPLAGRILLDGVDINTLALSDLRRAIGMVPQDPVIFSATIAQNIALGAKGTYPEGEVIRAAKQAAALEFIEKLPEEFQTYVGEKGVRLSGGQKQRLAIARALLFNPPILLLDEATSALDAENEQLVQQALAEAMEGRTTLVIAHRLATVKRADTIVVLENGRINATGTHEELLEKSELYARLARLQFTA